MEIGTKGGLTAVKFFDLNLPVLVQVLQGSWSAVVSAALRNIIRLSDAIHKAIGARHQYRNSTTVVQCRHRWGS